MVLKLPIFVSGRPHYNHKGLFEGKKAVEPLRCFTWLRLRGHVVVIGSTAVCCNDLRMSECTFGFAACWVFTT